jgi:hypothetical protein
MVSFIDDLGICIVMRSSRLLVCIAHYNYYCHKGFASIRGVVFVLFRFYALVDEPIVSEGKFNKLVWG